MAERNTTVAYRRLQSVQLIDYILDFPLAMISFRFENPLKLRRRRQPNVSRVLFEIETMLTILCELSHAP